MNEYTNSNEIRCFVVYVYLTIIYWQLLIDQYYLNWESFSASWGSQLLLLHAYFIIHLVTILGTCELFMVGMMIT